MVAPAGRPSHPSGEEPVHARSLGYQPGQRRQGSCEQPAGSNGHDHPKEVRFKDHRGRLWSPTYILIALVIVLVAILLLIEGVMLAPR